MGRPLEACPGCGISLAPLAGPSHPYMLGSAACWHGYGELLGAQYADPARMSFHQIVVDAYAAQHPGGEDPRAIRSVGIHLMTLALFLEQGVDPALGTHLHRQMVSRPAFHQLERPAREPADTLNFRHVPILGPPDLARERSFEWAHSVWESWGSQREVVRGWLASSSQLSR